MASNYRGFRAATIAFARLSCRANNARNKGILGGCCADRAAGQSLMDLPQRDLPPKQGLCDPRNEHDSCGVGFVADIKGRKSHAIVRQGLSILVNLDHRGAVGADPLVGDGAGCMIQTPDALLRDWALRAGVDLPPPGHYAVGMCFLPQNEKARQFAVKRLEHFIKVEGQKLVGWRDVPT